MSQNTGVDRRQACPTLPALTRRQGVLLGLISLLSVGLRLYDLGAKSLWYDEAMTLFLARVMTSWRMAFSAAISCDPPMMPLLMRFWRPAIAALPGVDVISPTSDFLIRLPAALFGILAAPLAFAACRAALKSNATALIAAFLVALSPLQVYYAQELRGYTGLVAFSLAALYFLERALDEDRTAYWCGFVLSLTLAMYAHFFGVWTAAMLGFYVLLTIRRHLRVFWKWALSQVGVILLGVPVLHLAYWINKHFSEGLNDRFGALTVKTGFITFKNFFAAHAPSPMLYWPLFLLCAALFLAGLFRLRKDPGHLALFLLLGVVPIAANIAIWSRREFPLYEHRLFIFSAAAASMVVAHGITGLRKPWAVGGALAVITVLTVPCLADIYADRIHPAMSHRLGVRYKVAVREAARFVRSSMQPGDAVVHTRSVSAIPFRHYLTGAQPTICLNEEDARRGCLRNYPNSPFWENTDLYPKQVDTAVKGARRVWVVQSNWEPFEYDTVAARKLAWFDEHGARLDQTEFFGVTVYLYDSGPDEIPHA